MAEVDKVDEDGARGRRGLVRQKAAVSVYINLLRGLGVLESGGVLVVG